MTSPPPRVVLLRSADDPDPYVAALEERGFAAACVPVLRFAFPRQDALQARLRASTLYAGLVVTSPRAVRALGAALEGRSSLRASWTEKSAYAVGPKTARELQDAGFTPRGEEAGSADALVAHLASEWEGGRLLFLSGNRRRDTLPDGLRQHGIPFDEQEVYETNVETDLALPPPDDNGTWLAFFSPSGLKAVTASGIAVGAYRLAAIGPTTAAALRAAGHSVGATAPTPGPEPLADAIAKATRRADS